MTRKLLALSAAAAAALLLSSTFGPANARPGEGGGGWAGVKPPDDTHLVHRRGHRGHHGYRHRHFYFGAPLVFGGYYGGYYGNYYYGGEGCYWLRRRAVQTGSHYWWDRYHACRNGYH
jgi:hypothetical protein